IEDVHAIERPAVEKKLIEAAELVCRRDHVRRRNDPGEEARIVRHRGRGGELDAEGALEEPRERLERGRAGEVVHGDPRNVGCLDAIAEPAEPERAPDLVREDVANRSPGDAPHDLAENEPAADGVICELSTGT